MAAYDPMNVNVSIASTLVTGFAEGSFVSCARNEDRINPYHGTKGDYAYAINNNNSGTITITLQQLSPMNDTLKRLANSKQSFAISVVDINPDGGRFRAGGNNAIIVTDPETVRSDVIEAKAWEIYVFDYSEVPA